jgi:hypothetical protein
MLYNNEIYQIADGYRYAHIPYGTGHGQIDCSHFVAMILEKATGRKFDYIQANAYAHSSHFAKVDHPTQGDIVFWHASPHGHVGIVLNTTDASFIGSQSTHGVGVQHYNWNYWRHHGSGPIFLRYQG